MQGSSEQSRHQADCNDDPPFRDKAVDVALAEYNALRAEIVGYITAQAALVGLALTAVGLIVGFAVKEGADERVLLAVPPVTTLVVLLHTAASHRSASIGTYIADELWGFLEGQVGELRSWEAKVADRRQRPVLKMIPEIFLLDFPAMIVFILASVYALAQVGYGGFLWWFDCIALVTAIAAALGFSLAVRKDGASVAARRRRPRPGMR